MRGGRRKNAGRKPLPAEQKKHIYKTISISGKQPDIEAIKEMARLADKTVSRFVIDIILKRP